MHVNTSVTAGECSLHFPTMSPSIIFDYISSYATPGTFTYVLCCMDCSLTVDLKKKMMYVSQIV